MADKLLSGFQALDLTDEKGLLCGKLLSDMGVDVIKVENPGGAPARNIPPFYHDIRDPEKSLYWFAYNTNKRSITLDLETIQGQDLFKKLVGRSDFVIESFTPGYMARLGLDYGELIKINPRIIMTSITPFGQKGPYSGFRASDIVIQALGVLLSQQGDPDRAPLRTSVPQAYMHAGADAAEATMIAHYYRGVTGEGQYVDVSAMESALWCALRSLPFWDALRTYAKRTGSLLVASGRQTKSIFECKDGYVSFHIQASLVGARTNQGLTDWMDREGMAPQFMRDRDWKNWSWAETTQTELDSLVKAISLFFKAHTAQELQDEATKRGLMLNKICDSADTVSSEQLAARDFWIKLKHDELNDTIIFPGAFAKFSLTPIKDWRRAPLIAEHNNDILKELGCPGESSLRSRQKERSGETTPKPQNQALSGLRVVGFVTAGVGPYFLRTLAIHGATVVIIENETFPDVSRTGSPFKDNRPDLNKSYTFAYKNTDKYSVSLDLKHPRAKEVVKRLIGWADLLVDNHRPGVTERVGLGYEQARAINPDIVAISLTHEGHTGPHRTVPGMGAVLAALSGLIHLTGWPDRAPVNLGAHGILPDFIAPRFGVIAALAALDYSRRTGKGQFIDLSEYESVIQFLIPAILDCTVNNRIQARDGNKSPCSAPHGVYRCKGSDRWCAIAVFTETEWEAFCQVIGNPVWTQEPKFKTLANRKENEEELNRLVGEWTSHHAPENVMMMMQQVGIAAGIVRTVEDVVRKCPQLDSRCYWWRLDHPEIGKVLSPGASYVLSKTPYEMKRPAPCLGEHNEYVCTRLLGIPDEEFIELYQEGVFK
jgi:crotonobetainyl-CoA:carnitine CoA-transferase CaiB-like acyl-CoA transferase